MDTSKGIFELSATFLSNSDPHRILMPTQTEKHIPLSLLSLRREIDKVRIDFNVDRVR